MLGKLGQALTDAFGEGKKVEYTMEQIPADSDTQCRIRLTLPEKTKLAYIQLRENIAEGQRVESFRILSGGNAIYRGYTIGNKKICPVNAETDTIEIFVTSARDTVDFRDITVFRA